MIEILEKPAAGPVIRLHDADNVVIARSNVEIGTRLGDGLTCRSQVPSGHKIAARAIRKGEPILKYNVTIGFAATDITPGTFVHSHNMEFREFDRDYAHAQDYRPVELLPESKRATFMGIVRANGQVATRNYIGVLSTVNCSATVVHKVAEWFTPERLAEFPNVDGVVAFAHATGCGMEMTGEPMDLLRRTMAGYALHANLAGALVIGLGCERNQVSKLFKEQGLAPSSRLRSFVMQDEGGTTKTIAAGVAAVKEMLPEANRVTRTRVPASHIMVGLQCGGSDGFSGLSANPALGVAMDILIRNGGTAILSETPEIFGVEHTLTARAVSEEVGRKLVARMDWWVAHTAGRDTQNNGRVSPGNQAGGISNVIEKSLGGAKKAGNSPLMEVYRYAEPVTAKGFVFMDTPGFDPVSATGQIAGGANLVAFTTGRGSCFGSAPAPTVKLATNTPMYRRMEDDMDINCGPVIDGESTLEAMGRVIFDRLLRHASGEKTKSELLGVGANEFVPWPIGVTA